MHALPLRTANMNLFDLLDTTAQAAQGLDDTLEKVRAARDMAEAVAGRSVLTTRFITRGVDTAARLREAGDQGRPPGALDTLSSVADFLLGEGDADADAESDED